MPVDESVRLETLSLPDGLPPWLAAFISEALRETDTLRENGADQAASARMAMLKKLVAAAAAWFMPNSTRPRRLKRRGGARRPSGAPSAMGPFPTAARTGRTIYACAA